MLVPVSALRAISEYPKHSREDHWENALDMAKMAAALLAASPTPPPTGEREAALEEAIRAAQDVLAEYIVPDSGIPEMECVNRLLSILDDQRLVRIMRATP